MKKVFKSSSIEDTISFATKLSKDLKPGFAVCLFGDLGTGKTVISKGICNYFGVADTVVSPTFNILKIYNTTDSIIKKIYHFDLYRIKSIEELFNLGFEEYISDADSIFLIEWPSVAMSLIENSKVLVTIDYNKFKKDSRNITYEFCE